MTLGATAAIHVMYAAFNLILAAMIGTWSFMTGYKGMATNKARAAQSHAPRPPVARTCSHLRAESGERVRRAPRMPARTRCAVRHTAARRRPA